MDQKNTVLNHNTVSYNATACGYMGSLQSISPMKSFSGIIGGSLMEHITIKHTPSHIIITSKYRDNELI